MRTYIFENARAGNNIVELFGLSRSGKSHLLTKMGESGKRCLEAAKMNPYKNLLFFIRYCIKHPAKALFLFSKLNGNWIHVYNLGLIKIIKIFKLRNSYLAAVLAKYDMIENEKKEIFADEFPMQSLFMIIQRKASENELRDLIKKLPQTRKILLIETPRKARYERIKKTRFPAQQIDKDYAVRWMKNMESNYPVIVRILKKKYSWKRVNLI